MKPIHGILEGNRVQIREGSDASRLYNKGHYGIPQSGGWLELHLIEAIYLVDKERLIIDHPAKRGSSKDGPTVSPEALLSRAVGSLSGFEVMYSVYRDLRERGYIIASPLLLKRADCKVPRWDLEVYVRGMQPSNRIRPRLRVFSVSERSPLVLGDLVRRVKMSTGSTHRVLLSLVDEEGDVTFYDVRIVDPKGRVSSKIKGKFKGHLLEDRVVMTDPKAMELHKKGYYGKPAAGKLQLSFLEAAYLQKNGNLTILNIHTGRKVGTRTFSRKASEKQPDYNERLKVYTDLRNRGMVVKTGFKYGTHFRVYQGDPHDTHARFLMHAVPESYQASWPELSRAVRVAHGVRKEIIFIMIMGRKALQFVQFKRVRP